MNFVENSEKMKDVDGSSLLVFEMSFLNTPKFLNGIISSIILISAIITFSILSIRSEITVIRSSGVSIWKIFQPIATVSFLLGIFWILVFDPLSIISTKKFYKLENKYVKQEMRDSIELPSGIWLKQNNIYNEQENILILARKVYQENLQFGQVTFWYFGKDNQFYKKIDADLMKFQEGKWELEGVLINDQSTINEQVKYLTIPTNLELEFIKQKILNDFKVVELYSFYQLPDLIKEMSNSGFKTTKFKVRFHNLLSLPFLFVAMTMIACYFGINHIRSNIAGIMIFLGMVAGLIIYISSSIINALGSSGLISVFASTWIITIIPMAVGVLLIYRKEHLN